MANLGVHREIAKMCAAKQTERRFTIDTLRILSGTKQECKKHAAFIPKCRRRTLRRKLRLHLGEVFKQLAVQHFWARKYRVSTVGRGEEVIREYIRIQEKEDELL